MLVKTRCKRSPISPASSWRPPASSSSCSRRRSRRRCSSPAPFAASLVDNYREYRANLGRGILIGLEILIAADIIKSVVIDPTLESMLVLGGIVVIRTFLSISLEVEINGHWPWDTTRLQREAEEDARRRDGAG